MLGVSQSSAVLKLIVFKSYNLLNRFLIRRSNPLGSHKN